jgi:hypothetical protein
LRETEFQLLGLDPLNEDTVGNPLHLMLIVAFTIILAALWRDKKWRVVTIYSICVPIGLLLIAVYLKWAPWIARYHLPSFMLWSPVVGLMLAAFLKKRAANVVAVVLLVAAVPWVLLNETRPLLGVYERRAFIDTDKSIVKTDRVAGYFISAQELEEVYSGAAEFVRAQGCSQIGLDIGNNDNEYQFWVVLKGKENSDVRIEHVNTPGHARDVHQRFVDFQPCAIIAVDNGGEKTLIANGFDVYRRAWWAHPVGVFVREGKS